MAIIFSIIVKANKDWYFSTHLAYLSETAYWLLAYSWIFRWEISQSWCNSMSYGIFTNFKLFCDTSCPVFATIFKVSFFLTQLFNNFFFFSVRKIRLNNWYHLRRFWRTLGIFVDGTHFEFSLQLCCLFWFWSFTPNMESAEIRIVEYNSKRMRQWEKEMKLLYCKTVWDAYCSRNSFIAMKVESSFTTLIASRGWHVYQKLTWKNSRKDEALSFKKETDLVALRFDHFSIASTRKSIEYLTPLPVGDISRFVYFLLQRGGKMEAKVYRTKCEVRNLQFQRAAVTQDSYT